MNRFASIMAQYARDPEIAKKLFGMVKEADMGKLMEKNCPLYDEWFAQLPDKPNEGFARECWSQVRSWSNGGGRLKAAEQMEHAIDSCNSENPRDLACTIYHSIVDHTMPPFEASCLTMHIVDEALRDCNYREASEVSAQDKCAGDYSIEIDLYIVHGEHEDGQFDPKPFFSHKDAFDYVKEQFISHLTNAKAYDEKDSSITEWGARIAFFSGHLVLNITKVKIAIPVMMLMPGYTEPKFNPDFTIPAEFGIE